MSETNIKVSELPEQEQKKLIAEAYAVGLQGFNFTSYKVETLKNKIAEQKAKNEGGKENAGENNAEEQTASNDEENISTDEQNGSEDEQANNEGENDDSIPEGASDETKAFLNGGNEFTANADTPAPAGETDELPTDAEEISEEATALETQKDDPKGIKNKAKAENKPKKEGICHICRSKVVDGVCTGCGFHK